MLTDGCYLSEGQSGAECILHQLGHLLLKSLHVLTLVGPSMMQDQLGNSLSLTKTITTFFRRMNQYCYHVL